MFLKYFQFFQCSPGEHKSLLMKNENINIKTTLLSLNFELSVYFHNITSNISPALYKCIFILENIQLHSILGIISLAWGSPSLGPCHFWPRFVSGLLPVLNNNVIIRLHLTSVQTYLSSSRLRVCTGLCLLMAVQPPQGSAMAVLLARDTGAIYHLKEPAGLTGKKERREFHNKNQPS